MAINESKKISVIVPVYKVEKYLDRCVQSIVDQTYRNLEIILVDDGSPDACPQMCDAWAMRDERIRVIHQENKGLAAVRNTGLDAAAGDFVCFVDSDDAIVPALCEKVMEAFAANDVEMVVFNYQRITENHAFLDGTEVLTPGVISKEDALVQLVRAQIADYLWNKVYKCSLFDDIRITRHRACFEDMEIFYRLLLKSDHIYCLDEPLYLYYQRSDSASALMTREKLCDLYQCRVERYRTLKTSYPQIAEQALPRVAAAALSLYSRSLWEQVDELIVADSVKFLEDNREKILEVEQSIQFRLYYFMPWIYRCVRRGRHIMGELVRYLQRKLEYSR